MTRRKKLPKIELRTVANGYTLSVEGHRHEYMYFTTDKLLEGFLGHIGMNINEQMKPGEIMELVDTVTKWKDIEKSTREIERLKRELDAMTSKRNGLVRQLMDERRDYISIRADVECMNRESKNPFGCEMLAVMAGKCLKAHKSKIPIRPKDYGITSDAVTDAEADDDETE